MEKQANRAVLLVIVLAVALCNSRTSAADERVIATIGHLPITDHVLLGIARERSGSALTKVEIEPVKFADYATLSESLRSGSLTGAFMLAPLAFQLKAKGLDIRLVLYGHRDGSAIVVQKKQTATDARALHDAVVAIPSRFSMINVLLHRYVSAAGFDYSRDVTVIEMPPPEMPAALSGGTIDAFFTAEPIVSKGELSGAGRILVFSRDIWPQHPCCVLVLSRKWLEEHPAAAEELLAALLEAAKFIEENKPEAAKLAAKFLGFDESLLRHALIDPSGDRVSFRDLVPRIAEMDELQSYLAGNMQLIKDPIDMKKFVDSAPAARAEHSLSGN